ncbi:MAG: hypothetical protein KKG92_04950, partial [Gammaproteobacteria bacterium]|nr:hypothetical protein [Gammaproteobacteria bacterium]
MSIRHRSPGLLVLIAASTLLAACGGSESQPNVSADNTMDTLVSTEWLSQHLADPDLVVLDCTVQMVPKEGGGLSALSGRAGYEEGHIPSAGFADLMGD